MRLKSYRLRSLTVKNGKTSFVDLDWKSEGTRAFVILGLDHLRQVQAQGESRN